MPIFSFKAESIDAAAVRGTLLADSASHAREKLRSRELLISEVRPLEEKGRASVGLWRVRRRGRASSLLRELSTLLGVGVPLLESLEKLAHERRGALREVLLRLHEQVSSGSTLAEAMSAEGATFSPLLSEMARVGEASGSLDEVLAHAVDAEERTREIRARVLNSLLYPAVVLAMALGVTILLMTFVVPSILAPLLEAGRPLPWVTRAVKGTSDLLVEGWWALLVAALVALISLVMALRTRRGLRLYHRSILAFPVLGSLILKQALARAAHILATLLRSGMTFLDSLEIARQSTGNLILSEALGGVRESVTSGREIAASLEETRIFPRAAIEVFSVGEESGRLEDTLDRLARDYDREVHTLCERLASLLEPVLILILAVIVGTIAFATLLPILEAGHVY